MLFVFYFFFSFVLNMKKRGQLTLNMCIIVNITVAHYTTRRLIRCTLTRHGKININWITDVHLNEQNYADMVYATDSDGLDSILVDWCGKDIRLRMEVRDSVVSDSKIFLWKLFPWISTAFHKFFSNFPTFKKYGNLRKFCGNVWCDD